MHKVPLLIDTCALGNKEFQRWLRDYHEKKAISTITYMEFSTFFISKGKSFDDLDRLLRACGIEVQPFTKRNAMITVENLTNGGPPERCRECNRVDWNDMMIASHAPIAPTMVVTENIKDYRCVLGERAVTPNDLMISSRNGN